LEDEPGRRSAAKGEDEARRIAANIAKLPESLGRNGKLLTSLKSPPTYSRFVIAIDMGSRAAMVVNHTIRTPVIWITDVGWPGG